MGTGLFEIQTAGGTGEVVLIHKEMIFRLNVF